MSGQPSSPCPGPAALRVQLCACTPSVHTWHLEEVCPQLGTEDWWPQGDSRRHSVRMASPGLRRTARGCYVQASADHQQAFGNQPRQVCQPPSLLHKPHTGLTSLQTVVGAARGRWGGALPSPRPGDHRPPKRPDYIAVSRSRGTSGKDNIRGEDTSPTEISRDTRGRGCGGGSGPGILPVHRGDPVSAVTAEPW